MHVRVYVYDTLLIDELFITTLLMYFHNISNWNSFSFSVSVLSVFQVEAVKAEVGNGKRCFAFLTLASVWTWPWTSVCTRVSFYKSIQAVVCLCDFTSCFYFTFLRQNETTIICVWSSLLARNCFSSSVGVILICRTTYPSRTLWYTWNYEKIWFNI